MNFSQMQAAALTGIDNKVKHKSSAEPKTASEISAKKSADEFEAIFISQMLKSMTAGIETDGPFGGGQSEDIYRDFMNEQLGKTITTKGGIGISQAVYRELLKTQKVSSE